MDVEVATELVDERDGECECASDMAVWNEPTVDVRLDSAVSWIEMMDAREGPATAAML